MARQDAVAGSRRRDYEYYQAHQFTKEEIAPPMKTLSTLILFALILLGVFVLVNWNALNAPTTLSFLAFTLEAPVGLLLLGGTLALVALFTAYVLVLRTAMLVDARRYSRELNAMHQLAEKAEASRIADLRSQLEHEFTQLRATAEQSRSASAARLDGIEQALRNSIEESSRTLSAYIGEVEDKLDRSMPGSIAEK
jgi:uncharacterized integral membrane protein